MLNALVETLSMNWAISIFTTSVRCQKKGVHHHPFFCLKPRVDLAQAVRRHRASECEHVERPFFAAFVGVDPVLLEALVRGHHHVIPGA